MLLRYRCLSATNLLLGAAVFASLLWIAFGVTEDWWNRH